MTRELLNTLFIQTQDSHATLKDDTVKVWTETETILRVPLHHLGSIFAFGVVHISSPLMMRCAEDGRSIVFFDLGGRFKARVTGKTGGNVLLRSAQWNTMNNSLARLDVARAIVAGKLQNSRQVLMRGRRDAKDTSDKEALSLVIEGMADTLIRLPESTHLDDLRGHEGFAAQAYFNEFDRLITAPSADFAFVNRSRRPPRDRMNALMSFVYSIATTDCVSALEGVGLDPQVGFLHVLRPGRPALALDLIEEFRSVILDRLCLTLVNRKQVVPSDFEEREGGSCLLTSDGRKKVLAAYQERKREEVGHVLFKEKVPVGLLYHIQARVLARSVRGELPTYIPYMPT
jgi:CRISPR-associated protein Cas1